MVSTQLTLPSAIYMAISGGGGGGGVLVLRTFQLVPQYIKESLSKLAEVVSIALCPCFLARNIVFLVLKLPMHIAGSKIIIHSCQYQPLQPGGGLLEPVQSERPRLVLPEDTRESSK